MTALQEVSTTAEWHPTACILCECNCGIEVRLGGEDGRRFERIRGDKAHPASKGYTCEKALRLDHYQNGRSGRILKPLRRRPDGTLRREMLRSRERRHVEPKEAFRMKGRTASFFATELPC